MSDLARWELRGAVRTLRTQFAEWNPAAGDWWPLKDRFVATFRADGQLNEIEHHNPDGSVPREVLLYDEAGRLTENQWWSDDVLTTRVLHTYDGAGRSASAVTVDADGTKHETERCRYDENGRKTKVAFLRVPETWAIITLSGHKSLILKTEDVGVVEGARLEIALTVCDGVLQISIPVADSESQARTRHVSRSP